jgi:FKBP-type peptidyl-prolyl cis-trans isomerase FkpA
MVVALLASGCDSNEILDFEEQLAVDLVAIDQHIEDNDIQDVQIDPSGIRYVIHEVGTGLMPEVSWIVKVKYKGNLLTDPSGTPFDQNTAGREFILSQLIVGWQIMLTQQKEGVDMTLYIPSGLAYGSNRQGGIPSNSSLIFDITLISARK